jgi:hypothetical protein
VKTHAVDTPVGTTRADWERMVERGELRALCGKQIKRLDLPDDEPGPPFCSDCEKILSARSSAFTRIARG